MRMIGGDNAYFLDLLGRYRRDPTSVPVDWRLHFEATDEVGVTASLRDLGQALLEGYRNDGHIEAQLDPLGLAPRHISQRLNRLRDEVNTRDGVLSCTLGGEDFRATPEAFLRQLAAVYAGHATLESTQIPDEAARDWLCDTYEAAMRRPASADDLARAGLSVALADEFESFTRLKFPTKKRFGSEGSEGSLVILQELLRQAALAGQDEVVMGGMHRGRLATLATVLGKSPTVMLAEIKGRDLTNGGADYTGDVPYHLGHTAELEFEGRPLRVMIAPHPSHLTVVAPVALGLTRAKRQQATQTMCVLLHTDAAFSGQGLASEVLQLSGLQGYGVGGTVHVVVNNQIGFTTLQAEGRTAVYCTDAAKMIGAPVLHVNGDDPVALLRVAEVASAWRHKFGRDVLIDLVCYRRNGHNELDEPRFTQPTVWEKVDRHPPLRQILRDALAKDAQDQLIAVEARAAEYRTEMAAGYDNIESHAANGSPDIQPKWSAIPRPDMADILKPVTTGLPMQNLLHLIESSTAIPGGTTPHPKIAKFYENRGKLAATDGLNFAAAEALAFSSLLAEGRGVRLSGQDCVRGTFTQRHLRVHDLGGFTDAIPVGQSARDGAVFEALNSPLSEYGVLGFEYGHSLQDPTQLTVWEAQFGDFLNGAQIVVDQFIVSAEAKWQMRSGLVLLLPHGLEGQGPDHSSARIERILQLCANCNIVVANVSTPANLFHLLRRQIHAPWRKPLFVASPKSLLRQKVASSPLHEFSDKTGFAALIGETGQIKPGGRAVVCSGKVYYDLLNAREEAGLTEDVALIRVEQLYPLDADALAAEVMRHSPASLVWCQEEPENQGAWPFLGPILARHLPELALSYAGRSALPVAAGGSIDRHVIEQTELVQKALLR